MNARLTDSSVILVISVEDNLGWSTYGDYVAGKKPTPIKKQEPGIMKMLCMLPFLLLAALCDGLMSF